MPEFGKFSAIDTIWARREAQRVIGLIEQQLSGIRFIDQARERKTKGGAPRGLEHEVIRRTQEAELNARDLCTTALRLFGHVENAGLLEGAGRVWVNMLDGASSVEAKDIWARLVGNLKLSERLNEAGVPDLVGQWLQEMMGNTAFAVGVGKDGRPMASSDDRKVTVIVGRWHQGKAESLGDLLFNHRFDAAVSGLVTPGGMSPPLLPIRLGSDGTFHITAIDGMLSSGLFYLQEFTRGRRRLEVAGLPIIAGAFDPSFLVIVGFILAGIGATLVIVCEVENKKDLCLPGGILLWLGISAVGVGTALLASALRGEAPINDWWELRAGDIPAYQSAVRGGL
jgi:hypothetical protein